MKKLTALFVVAVLIVGTALSGVSNAGFVDEIKEKGELTMLTATGFPPFEYLGEDGKPSGLDIDLVRMIADELGVKLKILDMSFNLLIESLRNGKGDIIAAGMAVTEERRQIISFSISYANNGQTLLVPKGSSIKTADDLKDKTVAVQESTTAHIFVQEKLGLAPLAFLNVIECAGALMTGKAEAAVMNRVPAMMLAATHPDKLEFVNEALTKDGTAMAVAQGHEDLLEYVDAFLKKAIEDGTVDSILEKHLKICTEG